MAATGRPARVGLFAFALAVSFNGLQADIEDSEALSGAGVAHCEDTDGFEFEEFRIAALQYYDVGYFNTVLLGRLSDIWRDLELAAARCAPAVLQAQLLKAEERALVGAAEISRFLARYTELLHEAVRLDRVGAADFAQWPLDAGLERVQKLRDVLDGPLPPQAVPGRRADMVMNFCNLKDRLGVSHALGWLGLEPLRGLLRSAGVRVVLYLVDRPHCDTSPERFAWLREAVGMLELVRYRGARRREEQSAYFKYLTDHYEDMPDFVIFVHPDAPEHQGDDFAALRRALDLMRWSPQLAQTALQYYPLALQLIFNPARTRYSAAQMDGLAQDWPDFWQRLFGAQENAVCPSGCPWSAQMSESFRIYVASQAIVGRGRILAHPKSYYAAFARDAEFCGNNSGNLEAAWHVIFGEPLGILSREENQRLPLALKWGVPTIQSDGRRGVI